MSPQRDIADLSLHPLADRVPAMRLPEYEALVADIARRGVSTPLDITSGDVVLDGRHRLQAAREAGFTAVPVRVVESADELDYMLSSAIERRHLSAGQQAVLALERDEYRQAQAAAHARKTAGTNELRATLPEAERSRDVAARLAGVSPRTRQDAITVRGADPMLLGQVRAGEVSLARAAQQVRRERKLSALQAPAVPSGPFSIVLADPPWQLGQPGSNRAPENHYPTLPLEEIKAVAPPVTDDAACFLWAVNQLLPEALEVLASWGFAYRTNLVWVKDRIGLGFYVRGQHELLLLGTRGAFPVPAEEDRPASVISARRGAHSAKPEEVYRLVERMSPGLPRVELFARSRREGWLAWGNEITDEREREVA